MSMKPVRFRVCSQALRWWRDDEKDCKGAKHKTKLYELREVREVKRKAVKRGK